MKKGIIYKATHISGRVYVGQTIHTLKRRKYQHLYTAHKGKNKTYFGRALKKYGEKQFRWETIGEFPQELLDAMEVLFIAYYDSFNNGFNLTIGGKSKLPKGYIKKKDGKKTLKLYHWDGRVEKSITQLEFKQKYNANGSESSLFFTGKNPSSKGWKRKPHKVFSFYHEEYGEEHKKTLRYMLNKYEINLSNIIHSFKKSRCGWKRIKQI